MTLATGRHLIWTGSFTHMAWRLALSPEQPSPHRGKFHPRTKTLTRSLLLGMCFSILMTSRTPNRNVIACGAIAVGFRRVVPGQTRTVAIRTLAVPVLIYASPVEWVAGVISTRLSQLKPTLPTILFWTGVPGNIKGLQAAIFCLKEILLKGVASEGISDRVGDHDATFVDHSNYRAAILLVKLYRQFITAVIFPTKITLNISCGGFGHRNSVIRFFPLSNL